MISSCIEKIALGALHKLPAETSHDIVIASLNLAAKAGIITNEESTTTNYNYRDITFKSRLGIAAGFDKNGDAIDGLAACGFGFIELGTVTPRPQDGNNQPRLFRIPEHQALINRMGFNNKGVDYLVNQIHLSKSNITKGVNIGKNKDTPIEKAVDDYIYCLKAVYGVADYIVVNLSSPNTPQLRELQFGKSLEELAAKLTDEKSKLSSEHKKDTPLLIKVAPDINSQELQSIIDVVKKYQIDGLVATNTTIQKESIPHQQALEQGGLSGKPLYQQSLNIITQARKLLPKDALLIGVGGISTAEDAQKFYDAGANLVQIYTGFVYQGRELINSINSLK